MLFNLPLMIIPFIIYNGVMIVSGPQTAGLVWDGVFFSIPMISGALWVMIWGEIMIVLGLFLLFFEILKSTRVGIRSVINHMLSTLILVAYLIEFLLVPGAATSVFFILLLMSLVDLMAGFSVSIRAAARDVTVGDMPI